MLRRMKSQILCCASETSPEKRRCSCCLQVKSSFRKDRWVATVRQSRIDDERAGSYAKTSQDGRDQPPECKEYR